MNLTGKHVLITGAGKRLGRAMAESFLSDRISLTAHGHHSRTELEQLIPLAKASGSKAQVILADLAKSDDIKSAVSKAVASFGPIDILINSASIFFPTAAESCTEADWDRLIDTNLRGQFFFAQAAYQSMQGKGGLILNIADTNALRPIRNHAPYLASKAGLLSLTESLAKDWAPKIRVNAISPGWMLSPENCPEEQIQRNIEMTLLKRMGSPDDIVAAARFLIENDYITGFNLRVDGGRAIA